MPNLCGGIFPKIPYSTNFGRLLLPLSLNTRSLQWFWSTLSVLPWNSTINPNCTLNSSMFSMSYLQSFSRWSLCSNWVPSDSRYVSRRFSFQNAYFIDLQMMCPISHYNWKKVIEVMLSRLHDYLFDSFALFIFVNFLPFLTSHVTNEPSSCL